MAIFPFSSYQLPYADPVIITTQPLVPYFYTPHYAPPMNNLKAHVYYLEILEEYTGLLLTLFLGRQLNQETLKIFVMRILNLIRQLEREGHARTDERLTDLVHQSVTINPDPNQLGIINIDADGISNYLANRWLMLD